MKHRRAILMLALAILLGLGAMVLASRWLLRQTPRTAGKIVVAASDVNLGQRLAPELLKLVDWPAGELPAGALSDPLKLHGRVLRTSVLRGEPLSEAKLAPEGTVGGLSALIGQGKRAITVRVNDVVGVAGFALPGNFVDILVNTQNQPGGAAARQAGVAEQAISKIVLERILVLAVAQEVGRDDTKPRVVNAVTLEVSPAQAEQLDLARSVGTLSLVLRNQVDPQPGTTAGATKDTLLGLSAPAAGAPALPVALPASAPPRPARAAHPAALAAASGQCSGVLDALHRSRECF